MTPQSHIHIPPPIPLPDAEERRAIREELGVTMLVEAAAGTGKTTCMTGRMAALLAGGHCASVDRLAAVTFTRKAAAELHGRFQGALEKSAAEAQGPARERLTQALEHIESCFIGTIHSFCARLLRERPVEAGVGVEFLEADEEDDQQMRLDAWEQTIAELYAEGGAALEAFNERRLDPALLREAFLRYCEYTDVEEWPAPAVPAPPLDEALTALHEYAAHIQQMEPRLPKDAGNDNLIPRYREIPRRIAQANLTAPADVAEIMERFDTSAKVIQRAWGAGAEGKEQAKAEQARWDDFRARVVVPFLERWREFRYETIMGLFQRGRQIYGDKRAEAGMLNYQDLLTRATALLKDKPHVREYFRKRYTHLLVDEFQDTDPVQAQAMLLLTADDPSQPDWRRCRPAPGSLFVVGDPKQSIYRFRRADIVTYNQVKDIICASGGRIVPLWANFRSTKGILDWVNGVFGDPEMFPQEADEYSPRYVALQSGRAPDNEPEAAPVIRLQAPEELKNQDAVAEWEAGAIARIIEAQIREGRLPGDFMIVTMTMSRLAVYGRMLEERGIPHEVTGGSALNEAPQVALLRDCLKALAEPDNPVALVAVLRGALFGISDPALYHFKRQGGEFCFHAAIPEGLPADEAALLRGAFERLRRHAEWLIRLPPAPAIERIAEDLGLSALAAAGPGGAVRSGSLAKAIELIREQQDRVWSLAELVQRLQRIVSIETKQDRYDGLSARARPASAVRVMNLHKVKGLEAPVVFLADPAGEGVHAAEIHIDRSQEHARGMMAIGVKESFQKKILAQPLEWECYCAEEERFLEAERKRLLYVAATRAKKRLVISQRDRNAGRNPWRDFTIALGDKPSAYEAWPSAFAEPAGSSRDAQSEPIHPNDAMQAAEAIAARWTAALAPSYAVSGVRQAALASIKVLAAKGESDASDQSDASDKPRPADAAAKILADSDIPQGTEWGMLIHHLLEIAMKTPAADIEALAKAWLDEEKMDRDWAAPAARLVHSVIQSDIWRRASKSARRFVEIPFQSLASSLGFSEASKPPFSEGCNHRPGEACSPRLSEGGNLPLGKASSTRLGETGSPCFGEISGRPGDPPYQPDISLILRGVIDLVFEEEDGWVIVDYKTDIRAPEALPPLAEHYRPQLQVYADFWQARAGGRVKELGLYFTHTDIYYQL